MKKYKVSIIFLLVSIICFLSFNIIGSEVAPDGTLIEPFFLVGIGSFSFVLSIISFIVATVFRMVRK